MYLLLLVGGAQNRDCGSDAARERRTMVMTQPNLRLVEGTSVDKTKALDAALSQIERAFGKGSIMRLGKQKALEVETVPTGSLGLDIALGFGGQPRGLYGGRYGPEALGKKTLT